MAYLLLITGALLILIAALPAWRVLQAGFNTSHASREVSSAAGGGRAAAIGGEEGLAERLVALQAEVAALSARLEEQAALPAATSPQGSNSGASGRVFQAYLAAARAGDRDAPPPAPVAEQLSFQEQIRRAHAAGEGIDSLARRFGRGKGEIALILNLQR